MSSVYKNGEQFRVFAQAVVAISVGVIFVAQGHSGYRTNHKYTQVPVSQQPAASTSSVLAAGDSR